MMGTEFARRYPPMSDKNKKIIRVVYHVGVTVALIVAAVCLIAACVGIYRTGPNPGDQPFSREVVAQHFAPIALPVYLCLGLIVVGFLLHPLLPETPADKPEMTATLLKRLSARTDLSACPAPLTAAVNKERRLRVIHSCIAWGFFSVGAVLFLWYALNVNHFHQSEINASMIKAMWVLLPCMGIPFLYGVFAAYLRRRSQKAELALLKQAPKEAVSPAAATPAKSERWMLILRAALVGLAAGLMVGGFAQGGWMDVLTKAINICTECIGLG